jgi:predicted Rossmann-fold nucleotide-binding protein
MSAKYTPTVKAYRNQEFLNSRQARLLRIMCEYEETMLRLKTYKIRATILVFGSARAKSRDAWEAAMQAARDRLELVKGSNDPEDIMEAQKQLEKVKKTEWMGEMTDKIENLSRLVTQWAMSDECQLGGDHSISGVTRYHYTDPRYAQTHPRKLGASMPSYGVIAMEGEEEPARTQGVYVCTGGGPGFMEAANKVRLHRRYFYCIDSPRGLLTCPLDGTCRGLLQCRVQRTWAWASLCPLKMASTNS